MQAKVKQSTETMYKKIKREYDQLLEKNQNDLIKIKIRQKQLNDKIAGIQKENQLLKIEIEILKGAAKRPGVVVKSIQQQSDPWNQIKQLKLNIVNSNQQRQALRKTIANLLLSEQQRKQKSEKLEKELYKAREDVIKSSKQIKQLSENIKNDEIYEKENIEKILEAKTDEIKKNIKLKDEKILMMEGEYQLKINGLLQQNDSYSQQISQLAVKIENQNIKKIQTEQIMKEKQKQMSILQQKVKCLLKQEEIQRSQACSKCIQMQQKLELHQQMLKSVKMMLKFKEMQLQQLKQ